MKWNLSIACVATVLSIMLLAISGTLVHAQSAAPSVPHEQPPAPVHTLDLTPPPAEPAPPKVEPPKPAPIAATKPSPERKLPLVDEGAADPSWVTFRNRLIEALRRGDKRILLSVVDRNIVNGLDAPRGAVEFRKIWELDTKDDRLLRELASSLFLGSAWYKPEKGPRLLCVPYVPIKWPLDDIDPYDSGAIVSKEALIKGAPSHASQTLGALSYDIVPVTDWDVADAESQLKQRWVKIQHKGRDGYVPEEQIRSAIEHRACFAKEGGAWRMVEYVIGIEFLGGSE